MLARSGMWSGRRGSVAAWNVSGVIADLAPDHGCQRQRSDADDHEHAASGHEGNDPDKRRGRERRATDADHVGELDRSGKVMIGEPVGIEFE